MFFSASGWLAAFLLTLAVELPVAAFLLRRAEPDRLRLALLIVYANLATHPLVWFVLSQFALVGTATYVLLAESWAIAAEALFYWITLRGLPARRALAVSLAANASSFLVGQLVGNMWPELFR
ncbi:MAG TPA: hypothetical protein VEI48_05485 [Candidatus Sulfotelmatobacter sp.]|nr:hypothetical protein [Candidatus Sulfotelmatobacter sp.]